MKYFGASLSEKHAALGKLIRKKDSAEEAKRLFSEIHAQLNMPQVYGLSQTEAGELLSSFSDAEFRVMPTAKDETAAWIVWHLARIEDVTMNILVAQGGQVFDDSWKSRVCSTVADTGNAMSDDEIMEFSKSVDVRELIAYRNAVAVRTREIVQRLTAEDMRRRVSADDIEKVRECGAVTEAEDSVWLLDYWGGKDVAGLLLMPPTRHAIMHLNACARIKQQLLRGKKPYRS